MIFFFNYRLNKGYVVRLKMPIDRPGFSHQANLGHVQNVDSGNARQRMLNTELAGRMKRERPQVRFMVVVTEDVQRAGVTGGC